MWLIVGHKIASQCATALVAHDLVIYRGHLLPKVPQYGEELTVDHGTHILIRMPAAVQHWESGIVLGQLKGVVCATVHELGKSVEYIIIHQEGHDVACVNLNG